MAKRAIILHGTDSSPTELRWQQRLREQFESSGYEVFFPQLPNCHTPNTAVYDEFLINSGWDFADSVIVGHSSGATAALHLLGQDWFPRVSATVLVGTFLNEDLVKKAPWYEQGQFDNLFVEAFVPEVIQKKSDTFYFVHGDDDPFCSYEAARSLCDQLGGIFITLPGAGHIAKSADIPELLSLTERLRQDGIIDT